MSSAISNLIFSLPVSSERGSTPKPLRRPPLLKPISRFCTSIKARAAEGRESLDHWQKSRRQQTQPRRRMAPVAPVGMWDRFPTGRTVQQMMDTMERIMEDPFSYPSSQETGVGYRRGRTPWEIKEGENEYNMRFDMPGMTKEDVKVWVEEKMLVVKAEKLAKKNQQGEEVEEGDWSAKSYGSYSSRIALPENIEIDKIKAEVRDGVLYINIPKARTSSQFRDINVQ